MTETEPDWCSAKGCRSAATWALLWNNPKLHTPERRKTWLACDEHREQLSDFLAARTLLKEVVAHTTGREPLPGEGPR
ncbi:acetone carboxylase [Nocardioides sp.]|uniref:acetone carboxylase n=1 Tax=Nocardioides sp. TaxID=35761 RepID=UPI0035646380